MARKKKLKIGIWVILAVLFIGLFFLADHFFMIIPEPLGWTDPSWPTELQTSWYDRGCLATFPDESPCPIKTDGCYIWFLDQDLMNKLQTDDNIYNDAQYYYPTVMEEYLCGKYPGDRGEIPEEIISYYSGTETGSDGRTYSYQLEEFRGRNSYFFCGTGAEFNQDLARWLEWEAPKLRLNEIGTTTKEGCEYFKGFWVEEGEEPFCWCGTGKKWVAEYGCKLKTDEDFCEETHGAWIEGKCICPTNSVGFSEGVGCEFLPVTKEAIEEIRQELIGEGVLIEKEVEEKKEAEAVTEKVQAKAKTIFIIILGLLSTITSILGYLVYKKIRKILK